MSPMPITPPEEDEEEEEAETTAEEAGFAMRSSTSTPTIDGTSSSMILLATADEDADPDDAADTTNDADADDDAETDDGLAMRSSPPTPMIEGSNSSIRIGDEFANQQNNIEMKAQLARKDRESKWRPIVNEEEVEGEEEEEGVVDVFKR